MDASQPYDDDFVGSDQEYRDVVADAGSTTLPSLDSDAAGGGDALMRFGIWYQGIHGYVCVVICIFGIVSNAMNIAVLTRRSMVWPISVNIYSVVTFAVKYSTITQEDNSSHKIKKLKRLFTI